MLREYALRLPAGLPPFSGGAVGCLGYDLGFQLEEKLQKKSPDDLRLPDCFLGFYNTALAIDHFKQRLYIFCAGFPEKNHSLQKALCRANLKKAEKMLCLAQEEKPRCQEAGARTKTAPAQPNFSRQEYIAAIKKAKEYIASGDIYQANLSQRFSGESGLPAAEIYLRLRALSPADFCAYQDCGEFQVISSSPERFLSLRGRQVFTRPMKGTRPRGAGSRQDAMLRRELSASPKDRAELMMITDLERNDLGRVCSCRSVRVTQLRRIERYRTVFQATAGIAGELRPDKDRVDLLTACFPGGSVTGCPKIRAMQVIEELEPHRRGMYTGCLGYLSFSGGMDFNILIRTILKLGRRFYFHSGGGIVADSRPENEYQETLVKAKAMMRALTY
jgi:para-aminobenzoate synthetase component 1